ncbi:MAG: nucleotide sugar dehydrogenase, partial [Actinobacteria bacterium]|nr:nucleotide sugar dehydrogenase [Actinomycetota bacterium]
LPVAVSFAEVGFEVLGVDSSPERVELIRSGESHIRDVEPERIAALRDSRRFGVTDSYERLGDCSAVLICVPTPMHEGMPDLGAIKDASRALGEVITEQTLVVLESTTYPGTTEEIVKPLLEASGLAAGSDFYLAFSPERIDPGNLNYSFADIPKVVGGVTKDSTRAAEVLYSQVVPKVVTVSGTREAEMSKLIENTFRHVNIALINELAIAAHDLGVDIWESIDAAATKPFGFTAFRPGPGWGGHCIPLDPSYLSWRVRQDRWHDLRFIELAHTLNSEMPRHVVERIGALLNEVGKPVRGARVLGIGVAYKGGTEDTRHSPGLNILSELAKRGARVSYHDPLVPVARINGREVRSLTLTGRKLEGQDIVIALVPQSNVDWSLVAGEARLIFDCCNAIGRRARNVHRL